MYTDPGCGAGKWATTLLGSEFDQLSSFHDLQDQETGHPGPQLVALRLHTEKQWSRLGGETGRVIICTATLF